MLPVDADESTLALFLPGLKLSDAPLELEWTADASRGKRCGRLRSNEELLKHRGCLLS